jgi:hypothetical protein
MPPKAVALIAALCLTTGWLLASVLIPPVARLQALPERRPPRPAAETPAPPPYSEQLKLRLKEAPLPPTPRRNPFLFGSQQRVRPPKSSGPSQQAQTVLAEPPVAAPAVSAPPFLLSGVATTDTAEGPIRTAVLSDGTTVHLVKVGDSIRGYSVSAVTADAVTLVSPAGTRHILQLR